jgi:hypothetical protein
VQYKIGGVAIAVVALTAVVGSMLSTDIATTPQKDRIIKSAKVAGASNVRIRAAELEAQRAPVVVSEVQAPVVVNAAPDRESTATAQPQSGGYTGTAPVPQTIFADEPADEPAAAESADEQ